MLTGYLGSCNLNLAGNQSNTSVWSSCTDRGLYTLAYRRCTCFCQFCNCNFSQEEAFNSSDTIPYYNTDISTSTNSGWVNAGARNTGYPYMWNLIPNITAGSGTITINVTSPRSISRTNPIYGYELSEFSLNSSNMTMNCTLTGGFGVFGGWRANSSAGTQCSTNLSFSPGWNTSYSDKSGTSHYKNIYQFYANGSFF